MRTEHFHHRMSRSIRLLSLLILPLVACGSTPPDSAGSVADPGARELVVDEPSAVDTDPVEERADEAAQAADEARTAPCADELDCTIVTDACGAPHARAVSSPDVPAAHDPSAADPADPVDPCPPVGYAPVEPGCESGACVARVVEHSELRTCEATSDCVAIRWACGGWWAVARAKQREAEAHARTIAASRACRASTSSPRPPVACVAHICIRR